MGRSDGKALSETLAVAPIRIDPDTTHSERFVRRKQTIHGSIQKA